MGKFDRKSQDQLRDGYNEGLVSEAETVSEINDKVLSEITTIEKDVFPEEMQLDEGEIKAIIENPKTITIVIKKQDEAPSGFVIAMPNSEVYEELNSEDPDFKNDPELLYVYDIAIEEKDRNLSNFLIMTQSLVKEACKKGFTTITVHARKNEGLSEVLQKRYGAHFIKTIENWSDYGEPFDYLELDLRPYQLPSAENGK